MNNKSPDPDNIPPKLIKILFANCFQFFVYFLNYFLKVKELPAKWKLDSMIHFGKPNRKINNPGDLRPITLINNWCKIGEALFSNRQFGSCRCS